MFRKITPVIAVIAALLFITCTGETKTQAQAQKVTVYVTRTGTRYHRAGCESLRRSKIPIDKADAIAKGYTPCQRCNP